MFTLTFDINIERYTYLLVLELELDASEKTSADE